MLPWILVKWNWYFAPPLSGIPANVGEVVADLRIDRQQRRRAGVGARLPTQVARPSIRSLVRSNYIRRARTLLYRRTEISD